MEVLALLLKGPLDLETVSRVVQKELIDKACFPNSNEELPRKRSRPSNSYSFSVKSMDNGEDIKKFLESIPAILAEETDSDASICFFTCDASKYILAVAWKFSLCRYVDYFEYLLERIYSLSVRGSQINSILTLQEFNGIGVDDVEEMAKRRFYWQNMLRTLNFPSFLRPEGFHEGSSLMERKVNTFKIQEKAMALVDHMCAECLITPDVVFVSMFAILLSRYSSQDKICFLYNFHNDTSKCKSNVFLKLSLNKAMKLKDIVLHVSDCMKEAMAHLLPCDEMREQMSMIKKDETSLVAFSYFSKITSTYFHLDKLDINKSSSTPYLALTCVEEVDGVYGLLEWRPNFLNSSTAEGLIGNLNVLMEENIQRLDSPISSFSILTNAEKSLFSSLNKNEHEFDLDFCIHDLFEKIAEQHPRRIAIIDHSRRITYEELNKMANSFGNFLKTHLTTRHETVIGVCMDKSLELIVCLLGIIKLGCAYLTLDPTHPKERLKILVKDSSTLLILVQEKSYSELFIDICPVIFVTNKLFLSYNFNNLFIHTQPRNLAYILYTSGTTGTPKGVMIEHKNTVAFIQAMRKLFNSDKEGILLSASYNFCLFHALLFYSLATGNTGILAQTILHVPHLDAKNEITFIANPPAGLKHLIIDNALPPSVKTIILGGDNIPIQLVQKIKSLPNGAQIKIFCTHGCTEVTLFDTILSVNHVTNHEVSIGKPFPGLKVYIVDENLQRVPIGISGEICVSGPQVSRGYIGNPAQLNKRYLPNPFEENQLSETNSGRFSTLYRTGDLGRWRPDGSIDLIGRKDFQIKIHGIRIEVDEICRALLQHSAIQEAVVVFDEVHRKEKELIAYVSFVNGSVIPQENLRYFLSKKLPYYMIPSHFISLQNLPRNINGKVDRKNLPKIQINAFTTKSIDASVQTKTQERLLSLVRKAFSDDLFTITDNLLHKGLDSLIANYLALMISMEFNTDFRVENIFKSTTVQELSDSLVELKPGPILPNDDFDPVKESELTEDEVLHIKGCRFKPDVELMKNPKNVFLTGATGFLGAFLLREILHCTEASVHCLVRASDTKEAFQRIEANMNFYNIWNPIYQQRIHCLIGDLRKPFLGLSDEVYGNISNSVDTIYHCGSLVNFAMPYSALRPYAVQSTKELIKFAINIKLKPVHYISSVAVHETTALSSVVTISEEVLGNGYSLKDMGYVRMKWVAEKLLWKASDLGLPVTMYRPSFIIGHTQTGAMPTKEFISRLIKGCVQMKCYPEWNYTLNAVPIDYVSGAVLSISLDAASVGKAFHLTTDHDNEVSVIQLFQWINGKLQTPLSSVSFEKWIHNLKQKVSKGEDNELLPLLHFVQDLSQDCNKIKIYEAKQTKDALKNASLPTANFVKSHMHKILHFFSTINFL